MNPLLRRVGGLLKRRALLLGLVLLVLLGVRSVAQVLYRTDRTPEGAYYRVAAAVNRGNAAAVFPYLETAAQHAAYTIWSYSKQSLEHVTLSYPEPERDRLLERLKPLAAADEGPGVFALYAAKHGWMERLRRDLSGIANVEIQEDRATVVTTRGTRYSFRRRENGIWGLTLFTPKLVADAERVARDASVITAAARDFEQAKSDQ